MLDSQRIILFTLNKLTPIWKDLDSFLELGADGTEKVKNLLCNTANHSPDFLGEHGRAEMLPILSDVLTIMISTIKEHQRENSKTVVAPAVEEGKKSHINIDKGAAERELL